MSIFYNLFTSGNDVDFLNEYNSDNLSLFTKNKSFTKVFYKEYSSVLSNSTYIGINKSVETNLYKKEIITIVKKLMLSQIEFLLVFNGEIPLFYYHDNRCYINDINHFENKLLLPLGGKETKNLSELYFDRVI